MEKKWDRGNKNIKSEKWGILGRYPPSNYIKIVICAGLLYFHNEISNTYPENWGRTQLVTKSQSGFACICTSLSAWERCKNASGDVI